MNINLRKQAFEKLETAVGFDTALEIATGLGAISRKRAQLIQNVRRGSMNLPLIEGEFPNVAELVEAAVASSTYVTWPRAYAVVFEGEFQSARARQVVEAFEAVISGASALIVDSKGYQSKKTAECHREWLTTYGYTLFPGIK
jgi:hypothetical protein